MIEFDDGTMNSLVLEMQYQEEDDPRALSLVPLRSWLPGRLHQQAQDRSTRELMMWLHTSPCRLWYTHFLPRFQLSCWCQPHSRENILHKNSSHHGFLGSWAISKENWAKNNLNSPTRVNFSREERKQQRIELLRLHGVPKQELILKYEVPESKRGQGPLIDELNNEGTEIINLWQSQRRDYYYYLIFGKGSAQVLGSMEGICDSIEYQIRPGFSRIVDQIRREHGDPVLPPAFFKVSLRDLEVPVLPSQKRK